MYKAASRFSQAQRKKGPGNGMYGRLITVGPNWRDPDIKRLDAIAAANSPALLADREAKLRARRATRAQKRPSKPRPSPRMQRIYLVRFALRANISIQFIKVGISGLSLKARFQGDASRYEYMVVGESKYLARSDAKLMERAIHAAFKDRRHRPVVPLKSGNTECFLFSEEMLARMKEIICA